MTLVVLIPTGRLEYAALAPALAQLFPDTSFVVRPQDGVLNGFTSRNVSGIHLDQPGPWEVEELAAELVAAVVPGRRGVPADFAYVIDDLELANDHQPELVVQVFRDAVVRHIESTWPSLNARQRVYATVRDRCSFHLFRPMTEAYFFGEFAALTRAGAASAPQLAHSNWEEFLCNDTTYLGLPARSKPVKDLPDRQRHPKSYLHYLCDPTLADKKRQYKETKNGVAALTTLAWEMVLTEPPHCPFLHAFLDDLAEALQARPAFVLSPYADARTRWPGGASALLRNA